VLSHAVNLNLAHLKLVNFMKFFMCVATTSFYGPEQGSVNTVMKLLAA